MAEVSTMPIARNMNFRSKETVRMIRVEKKRDGTEIVIDANLPVGRGFGSGTVLDYINQGWRSYDEYTAEQHSKEVAAKREGKK